ncbi:nuclear pore complex subunit Nup192 [Xylona heveae TC161]|uniref:Nuclear pore complex subunit Nup192 n=1 Tax=Xylona heveae (strain CBS 132557 / TC161) TaxID=1328760 RepID=A0A165JWL9_XYLHT|nr:nuclear pore complex subunit Nup192 [Xylona heveae TC161]KZF26715.1 nuclear pore complex subunit Nup192 [Xylona heveae TC161]
MADTGALVSLRGLHQDLVAVNESRLQNVERLWFELETRIEEFRKLLDKPPKNDSSRRAISAGTITIDDVDFALNEEFQQNTFQLADALNLDEINAARLLLAGSATAAELDRTPLEAAFIVFHQERHFLLECLRLVFKQSVDIDSDENIRNTFRNALSLILQTAENPAHGGSLFWNKCLGAMADIEKWLHDLAERFHSASMLGINQQPEFALLSHQRLSLLSQHESLGAIAMYLVKSNHTVVDDFKKLLNTAKSFDRFDAVLLHYLPALAASITQFGSPDGSSSLQEARSLDQFIAAGKESNPWNLHHFQAAISALWLADYSGWYSDTFISSPLQGVNLEVEADDRSRRFFEALQDGAFECLLAISADVRPAGWYDPARYGLTQFLLGEAPALNLEGIAVTQDFQSLVMGQLESFTDAFITNMADALRQLKIEEDEQRKQLRGSLAAGTTHHDMHLERFLVIISYAFEHRPDSSLAFWADPEGNLHGFMQWASKRQSTPRASAFCEMLRAISEGEECADAAHKFLLEDGVAPSGRLRRMSSISWVQIFNELQFYASKIRDRPAVPQTLSYHGAKPDPDDIDEPESAIMLECYLRLTSHMLRESSIARNWILEHPSFRLMEVLFLLCSSAIPSRLRACAFTTLESLLVNKTSSVAELVWATLDQWISGGFSPLGGLQKVPSVAPPVWAEEAIFENILADFEEPNAFVGLLQALVAPAIDNDLLNDSLPFPESLGSAYRMPGIEPYVDFAVGRVFGYKLPELQDEGQITLLTWNCLNFIATCLSTFNEDLVIFANKSNIQVDTVMRTSSLVAYIKLHPFARVMEWLFNERVLASLFAAAHQDVDKISQSSPDSPAVLALLRSIEVMSKVMDLQSTYLDIVRPLIKTQSTGLRHPVATSALASFEDSVLNNLQLIVDLGLYCAAGHEALTVISLKLLEKLATSRKLISLPSSTFGRRADRNSIFSVLDRDNESDRIARSLTGQMDFDERELEQGPESPGFVIKVSIVDFLNSCLTALPNKPTIAHLLLGFACRDSIIEPGSLIQENISLFHAILSIVTNYQSREDDIYSPWQLRLKESVMRVFKHLWSSPLSAVYTMTELRSNGFLLNQMLSQSTVDQSSLWDGRSMLDPDFYNTDSAKCFLAFLQLRGTLFDYISTEVRLVSQNGASSSDIFYTLQGSTLQNGQEIVNPTIFDLFDFAELEIPNTVDVPCLSFFSNTDFGICLERDGDEIPAYNLSSVQELLQLKKIELEKSGVLSTDVDEEAAIQEANKIIAFLNAHNQYHSLVKARIDALRAWVQLMLVVLETSELEAVIKTAFIIRVLQVILPKLEKYCSENATEALELAKLARALLFSFKFASSLSEKDQDEAQNQQFQLGEDLVSDRLFQLFRVALRGIHSPTSTPELREVLYNICHRYLIGMADGTPAAATSGRLTTQTIKASGERLVDVICDDVHAGDSTCRISAILLLDSLVLLSNREGSKFVIDSFVRLNFIGILVDAFKRVQAELKEIKSQDMPLLIAYYKAKLSLLLRISQTRLGAAHVLSAGLFQALNASGIFTVDPDFGPEFDDPEVAKNYFELLLSILRVINAAVLSRGPQHTQTIEEARRFLVNHRYPVVGMFKRHAKIESQEKSESIQTLDDVVENFVLLITMTGFMDVTGIYIMNQNWRCSGSIIRSWGHKIWHCRNRIGYPCTFELVMSDDRQMLMSKQSSADQRAENCQPHTKRKQSQQQTLSSDGQTPPSKQRTISELFSPSTQSSRKVDSDREALPSSKRVKLSHAAALASSPTAKAAGLLPAEKMYKFNSSNSASNNVIDLTKPHSSGSSAAPAAPKKPNGVVRPSNFTPHTGAKRLTIKNLRKTPRIDPDQYFAKIWGQLDTALTAIYNKEKVSQSLEELYKGVENLCRQDRAANLYGKLCERCKDHVMNNLREPLIAKAKHSKDVDLLRAVLDSWAAWNGQLMTIRSIFFYMDRSYLLHSSNPSINDMALALFGTHVFSDPHLRPSIIHGACNLVEMDRTGRIDIESQSLFRDVIRMFHELGVYTKEFEPAMLHASQTFFVEWSENEIISRDLAGYVKASNNLMERETDRCDLFNLDSSTRRELLTLLENILVGEKVTDLLDPNSIAELLNKDDILSLAQLFSLLQRQRLGIRLRGPFESYIHSQGLAIVFDEERENDMIVRLLEFKRKLDSIWRLSFQEHENLGQALRETFESFINKSKKSTSNWNTDNSKPGEMIAKYVDRLLRSGTKAIPQTLEGNAEMGDEDAELDKQLDQVLDLFRFVHGKAVFEAFYKKDLARRLLMGRSASADAERSMLTRLKSECGAGFTHNLEQMFKDVDLAREEMASYRSILEGKQKKTGMDLNVNVLSASAWPTYPDVTVNVPPTILSAINDFDQHYKSKHTGRKLTWKHSLAHCQLKARFRGCEKEIVVSSFQAIVLLLFNDVASGTQLSYPDIRAATGLPDVELKRTLQSLACARYRVLTKTPKGRDVNEDDKFNVNLNFSDPKYRIKINQIQLKETKEENKETHERVVQDRHYETQAAIVRIMKSRKTIKHAELVAEVITATKSRGVLDPADIKKNIEKLIEKEYMEREEGNEYKYLA